MHRTSGALAQSALENNFKVDAANESTQCRDTYNDQVELNVSKLREKQMKTVEWAMARLTPFVPKPLFPIPSLIAGCTQKHYR